MKRKRTKTRKIQETEPKQLNQNHQTIVSKHHQIQATRFERCHVE